MLDRTAISGCAALSDCAAISDCAAAPDPAFNSDNELPAEQTRAWIELSGAALRHNVSLLGSLLPEGCELMPAVKANAYGHGDLLIAEELQEIGLKTFCVACVEEGVKLRKAGIEGTILVLGYTCPGQFPLLLDYGLTQTIVDYPYALSLQDYPASSARFHVHIAIDTGMHRLGERYEHLEKLRAIFRMDHLQVDGLYTHLCVSDSHSQRDEDYTHGQIRAFYQTVGELKVQNGSFPKLHLLSSYGLLNYPDFCEDYVRTGIALYGMLSTKKDTEDCPLSLRPVLSLKARVACVRALSKGESAGYGLAFTSTRPSRIAALSIGYADGLPRSLSNGSSHVLINGRKAPVIGRICMDQTLVDVTEIPDVNAGSVAVIIGRSGNLEITACDLAEWTGTIANEILSRLGERLHRILLEPCRPKRQF